jgi:hypothetical protein
MRCCLDALTLWHFHINRHLRTHLTRKSDIVRQLSNSYLQVGASHPSAEHKPPIFYVVDWLPPDFGAVGQYALIHSQQIAAKGRQVYLIGLTHGEASREMARFADCGLLTIQKLRAKSYIKTNLLQRLIWTLSTNIRLLWAVFRQPDSQGAEILFTGAPPFMLYFAIGLKYLRRAHLTYRITDFYPEAIIAHWGRRSPLLALLERLTWLLRKRVDLFEVLGEDQRELLLRGGIPQERIVIKRDAAPVPITGKEMPAPKPPGLGDRKVLLYSGNYGIAHEVETVAQGLARHHQVGTGRFALWLNATGENADILERRLLEQSVLVARTAPVDLKDFPALLAAADAHLITLRSEFAGIVFPSKVYACIRSGRPIIFIGPKSSDVHLLCTQAQQRYIHITPGDVTGFAQALEELSAN